MTELRVAGPDNMTNYGPSPPRLGQSQAPGGSYDGHGEVGCTQPKVIHEKVIHARTAPNPHLQLTKLTT